MWINRKAKYPYVQADAWVTRVWLLIKKVDRQRGISSFSDRRVAVELLRLSPKRPPADLMLALEEVVCGAAEEHPYQPTLPFDEPSKEGLG